MVIHKTVCRDCDNAITHNTECCPSCASTASSGYYRNADRLLFLLTLLPVRFWLSFQASVYLYCCGRLQVRDYPESTGQNAPPPLSLLCQTVTHRPPVNTRKPQQIQVGNARKSAHDRPHLRTPFPFDFEFFVVAIPLNVTGIILVPDNRNIFSF